jgi:hypothetical protein
VRCSDAARRPRIRAFASGAADGGHAFAFSATDPNRDIERYFFDLTDCAGTSVLSSGVRSRRGLQGGRTSRLDSVVVIGAFEFAMTAADQAGYCPELRIEDEEGNSSPWVRLAAGPAGGQPPTFVSAGVGFVGTTAIEVSVSVQDADGDLAGLFPYARLSDGTLGPVDGHPDLGAFNTSGYLIPPLPLVPLGPGRPGLADFQRFIVYGVDWRGNVSRREISVLGR